MKTYNVFGVEMKINIKERYVESMSPYVECCYYYDVYLKNKEGNVMKYLDFEYFDNIDKNEDDIFKLTLSRFSLFENAVDEYGNQIHYTVFESFLGSDWEEQYHIFYKLNK